MPKKKRLSEERYQTKGALTANERQVGGNHYKSQMIQPWDYIAANDLDYFQGNIVKYVSRWKDKGGVEDLRKAAHYLQKYIEIQEADPLEKVPPIPDDVRDECDECGKVCDRSEMVGIMGDVLCRRCAEKMETTQSSVPPVAVSSPTLCKQCTIHLTKEDRETGEFYCEKCRKDATLKDVK